MAEGALEPTDWLRQLLARRPDLAASPDHSGAGFLHLASRLILPLDSAPDALSVLADEVRSTEPLPDLGTLLVELRPGVELAPVLGRIPEASPVHVFAVPEATRGRQGFRSAYLSPPPEPGPTHREVTVAVLDTGVVAHPWFTRRPWWERVPAAAVDQPGGQAHGHGTFLCGLVLQQEPEAALLPVRVVDADGLVDELTLARAIQGLAEAVNVAILPVVGYTWNDRPPSVLTRVLAMANERGVVLLAPRAPFGLFAPPAPDAEHLAAGGRASEDRPVFPAASGAVCAVGPAPIAAVSSYPIRKGRSSGTARASGVSFGSALLAGWVATSLLRGASDGQEALQWAVASARSEALAVPISAAEFSYQPSVATPRYESGVYRQRSRPSLLGSALALTRSVGTVTTSAARTAISRTAISRTLRRRRAQLTPEEYARVMVGLVGVGALIGADNLNEAVVRPSRIVSTGFARPAASGEWLSPARTLAADTDYMLLFRIGDVLNPGAIDESDAPPLPLPAVSAGTRLRVLLFGFAGGFAIDPAADMGELIVGGDGRIRTARQPGAPPEDAPQGNMVDEPLQFPVRTGGPGVQQLRCSVYVSTKLLQSRVISAVVTSEPEDHDLALRATVDYTLTRELDSASMADLVAPRLSVMINEGTDGTHDFRFVGESDFKGEARLDADQLHATLTSARRRLRRVAWDTPDEWTTSDVYRYKTARPHGDLVADLIELARSGYRIWYGLTENLAGSAGTGSRAPISRQEFRALMRAPGSVEFCSRSSVRLTLPTALVYDAPLDSNADDLTLCPDFDDALRRNLELLSLPCLLGGCPSYADIHVVCPSGFWGFRHEIGVPVSLAPMGSGATETATVIPGAENPSFLVGVTTDPTFVRLGDHLRELHALHVPVTWDIGKTRGEILTKMQGTSPHIVYFLCHGAESNGLPALVVGDPDNPQGITPDNLEAYSIAWRDTRPLVVLNGCQTAALDPTKPLNFVEAFTREAFASGVIGTEISVFEELACDFAEQLLRRFITHDLSLGRAVREARLTLLQDGNPLGLVYVPFGSVGLRMAAAS